MDNATVARLAQQAIDIQDACNPVGLANAYGEVLNQLCAAGVPSGDEIARHPVNRLWVSKLHDLADMGLSSVERYGEAYEACKNLSR